MKKTTLVFTIGLIISLFVCGKCISQVSDSNKRDSIEYTQYYHDKNGSLIIVDGIINDSIKGAFEIDSGLTGWDMIIDSAFFFQNFDPRKFVKEQYPKMTFYRESFRGNCTMRVGNHEFTVKRLLVENLNVTQHPGVIYNGILGSTLFENKITIIDFESRQLAFLDTIDIDSSYVMVEFKPSRDESAIRKSRFIKISGFMDLDGKPMNTQFLFDLGNAASAIALKNEVGVKISNPIRAAKTVISKGLWNKPLKTIIGNVDSLSMGPFYLNNPTVSYGEEGGIMDPKSQLTGGEGLLGLGVLVRFHLMIDYKANKLYIKPNAYYKSGATYFWDASKDSIYMNKKNR